MTASRSTRRWPRVCCWVPPIGERLPSSWKIPVHRGIFRLTDWLSLDVATRFYTVQGNSDICRLRANGRPWPEGEFKAHLGPGVYAWGVRQDAEDYKEVKQKRVPVRLQVIEFRV